MVNRKSKGGHFCVIFFSFLRFSHTRKFTYYLTRSSGGSSGRLVMTIYFRYTHFAFGRSHFKRQLAKYRRGPSDNALWSVATESIKPGHADLVLLIAWQSNQLMCRSLFNIRLWRPSIESSSQCRPPRSVPKQLFADTEQRTASLARLKIALNLQFDAKLEASLEDSLTATHWLDRLTFY